MDMNLRNESGFTLLEALIVLMMTSSIMLLLVGGLLQTTKINQKIIDDSQFMEETADTVTGDRQIEWHLFLNQLEFELQGSINPVVSRAVLSVDVIDKDTNNTVKIEYRQPYATGSRRYIHRYKNNGNIRMLSGVEVPRFEKNGNWLILNFSFRNGEKYTGRIWIESWGEETNTNTG